MYVSNGVDIHHRKSVCQQVDDEDHRCVFMSHLDAIASFSYPAHISTLREIWDLTNTTI